MAGKPVIVSMALSNPSVMSELKKSKMQSLFHLAFKTVALLDIISGKAEPSALLPMGLPADMKTVEEQKEDLPHDKLNVTWTAVKVMCMILDMD